MSDQSPEPNQTGPVPPVASQTQTQTQSQTRTQPQSIPRAGWERLPRWFVPSCVILLAIFLVFVFVNDWNVWDGRRSVEETDDAYVRADITPLSTKVAGVVEHVAVTDYQAVKKGELIVQIRNDDFQARVDQAKAAVDETKNNIDLLKQQIAVQDTRIEASQAATAVGNTNVSQATTNISTANATIELSQAAIKQARDTVVQADSDIKADQANLERALLEKNRQEQLFADRATTKRALEQITANYDEVAAALARDRAKRDGAIALLAAKKADLLRSQDLQINTARQKNNAGQEYTKLEAEHKGHVKEKDVLLARERVLEAELAHKKADLKEAQVNLDYTYIRAPENGAISDRKVRAGQLVSPGTQAVTLVSAVPWVIANYREIQLSHVFVGNHAEVTVDGLPGVKFVGKVDTISPASEAQFALLPPENASGNFTKISQRIPVKITFDPDQKELNRMRPGMSVIARVWTK